MRSWGRRDISFWSPKVVVSWTIVVDERLWLVHSFPSTGGVLVTIVFRKLWDWKGWWLTFSYLPLSSDFAVSPTLHVFFSHVFNNYQELPVIAVQPPPLITWCSGQDGVSQLGGNLWDGENHGGFVANGLWAQSWWIVALGTLLPSGKGLCCSAKVQESEFEEMKFGRLRYTPTYLNQHVIILHNHP